MSTAGYIFPSSKSMVVRKKDSNLPAVSPSSSPTSPVPSTYAGLWTTANDPNAAQRTCALIQHALSSVTSGSVDFHLAPHHPCSCPVWPFRMEDITFQSVRATHGSENTLLEYVVTTGQQSCECWQYLVKTLDTGGEPSFFVITSPLVFSSQNVAHVLC